MEIKFLEKKRKAAKRKRKKEALKNGAKGLAIGSVAGAIGAALITPKTGKETRKAIVQGADIKNRKEKIKEKGKNLKSCSSDFFEKRKEKIESSKETIKGYLKNKKREDIGEEGEILEDDNIKVENAENVNTAEGLVEEE